MRKYTVTYRAVVESFDGFSSASEEFEAARVGEILEDGTVGFELDFIDAQQHPVPPAQQEFPSTSMRPFEALHEEEGGQTYPADAPPHPWDQGMWIFPDDHPLAGYERAAKMSRDDKEKQAFLEAGRLMLPPGEDDDS
jgi:hypothetical protein